MIREGSLYLGELQIGKKAVITGVTCEDAISTRLQELGLLTGECVEILHMAPMSRDPIAVQVRGNLVALRRNEANRIEVELVSEGEASC